MYVKKILLLLSVVYKRKTSLIGRNDDLHMYFFRHVHPPQFLINSFICDRIVLFFLIYFSLPYLLLMPCGVSYVPIPSLSNVMFWGQIINRDIPINSSLITRIYFIILCTFYTVPNYSFCYM
jgi:hypothetical protein